MPTTKIRPLLYVVAALLLGALYVQWCHDPQVRREAMQRQQDVRDNITIARLASESFQAETLHRRELERLNTQIGRLKASLGGRPARPDTVTLRAEAPPSSSGEQAASAPLVDTRDSIIALQDSVITKQGAVILALTANITAYRDSIVPALMSARENWKRAARPGLLTKIGRAIPWLAGAYIIGRTTK